MDQTPQLNRPHVPLPNVPGVLTLTLDEGQVRTFIPQPWPIPLPVLVAVRWDGYPFVGKMRPLARLHPLATDAKASVTREGGGLYAYLHTCDGPRCFTVEGWTFTPSSTVLAQTTAAVTQRHTCGSCDRLRWVTTDNRLHAPGCHCHGLDATGCVPPPPDPPATANASPADRQRAAVTRLDQCADALQVQRAARNGVRWDTWGRWASMGVLVGGARVTLTTDGQHLDSPVTLTIEALETPTPDSVLWAQLHQALRRLVSR